MAKQTFTTGQVLLASQLTSLQQTAMGGGEATAKTASYVLVAADAGALVIMNSGSSTTITANTGLFAAGDTVTIQNIGAGITTITAGTATVNTSGSLALAQYESGTLYFTSTSAAIFRGSNPGDITGVTAGTGISGGGTSGTVTITNSMATTIDAKGDLIVGTGADAFSRLAVGATNGQVLTVDSAEATGLKYATPAGASFVGCSVSNSANLTIANNTFVALTWNTQQYNTNSIHSTSTNTSRFTIPSGKDGKYLFTSVISWPGLDTPAGYVGSYYYKNGTLVSNLTIRSYGITPAFSNAIVLNLAVADYIEFYVKQTSGIGDLTVLAGSGVQVSYLGA